MRNAGSRRRGGGGAHGRGRARLTPARLSLGVAALYALWLVWQARHWSAQHPAGEHPQQPSASEYVARLEPIQCIAAATRCSSHATEERRTLHPQAHQGQRVLPSFQHSRGSSLFASMFPFGRPGWIVPRQWGCRAVPNAPHHERVSLPASHAPFDGCAAVRRSTWDAREMHDAAMSAVRSAPVRQPYTYTYGGVCGDAPVPPSARPARTTHARIAPGSHLQAIRPNKSANDTRQTWALADTPLSSHGRPEVYMCVCVCVCVTHNLPTWPARS
jgi:hypothetical protein